MNSNSNQIRNELMQWFNIKKDEISHIESIKIKNALPKLKEINNKNIEGIIVGKAIYDGDIKLDELAKEISA